MAISEPRYRFHQAMVSGAPESAGLYALWHETEMIFLGRSECIKEALLDRLNQLSAIATHYSWHVTLRAAGEEVDLLDELRRRGQPLPLLNRQPA